jgi:UDP-N-acetylmuramate: L-alanyl-gamma-D-glutamyl-meso-diaminopimelate ligase
VYPPMSDFLIAEGIKTFSGYSADNITNDLDLVVVGNAISRGNVELETVLERKMRYCSLPEAIRDHFLWGARSIVLSGTHGKTTTTSLTGWLLTHGGLDPSILVGGIALNFGSQGSSYRVGRGRDFVIEGDEYDSAFFDKTAKFLKYLPDIAVINNIEFDHADIYTDLEAVLVAFRRLVRLVPRNGLLLIGADSPHAKALAPTAVSPVETFGLDQLATWRASAIEHRDGQTRFDVHRVGQLFGRFESPLLGVHNVRNALAAIAVGARVGLTPETLVEGLRREPSDGRSRNTGRAAHRLSGPAAMGGLRAAFRVLLPARLSGRLRQGLQCRRRSRRRRSVSLEPARSRTALRGATGRRPLSRRPPCSPHPRDRRHCLDDRP